MNLKSKNEYEINKFQKDKIKSLNKFFMRNIIIGSILSLVIFGLSIVALLFITKLSLDVELRITLLSITATFILTTAKTLIDKVVQIVQYLVVLLSEEQRGINKNIGIDIDKVDFENVSETSPTNFKE
ncbi:MAG: hypothetical protein LBV51_00565 [Acholeplasmatales bacterium]|jgi:hypothetical protein|nr:hypothetical protein [Acholeplasmatales bacterium]